MEYKILLSNDGNTLLKKPSKIKVKCIMCKQIFRSNVYNCVYCPGCKPRRR